MNKNIFSFVIYWIKCSKLSYTLLTNHTSIRVNTYSYKIFSKKEKLKLRYPI